MEKRVDPGVAGPLKQTDRQKDTHTYTHTNTHTLTHTHIILVGDAMHKYS